MRLNSGIHESSAGFHGHPSPVGISNNDLLQQFNDYPLLPLTGFGLLLSITSFLFVLSWQPRRGRMLMLAFVFVGLILPKLLSFVVEISVAMSTFGFSDPNILWIYRLVTATTWICRLVGSGLLLSYVI